MAEKQELNSLNRFRKQSAKLVLEEHGHCEVPAGCGGVILRWRNPLVSRTVRVFCYTPNEAKLFMDGEELERGLTDLAIGPHLLCVENRQGPKGNSKSRQQRQQRTNIRIAGGWIPLW